MQKDSAVVGWVFFVFRKIKKYFNKNQTYSRTVQKLAIILKTIYLFPFGKILDNYCIFALNNPVRYK